MIARILALAAAVGAMIGAAGAIVVAIAFAIYALLKDLVTPAGASACVALVLAVLCGIGVLATVSKAKGPKRDRKRAAETGSPLDRFIDFAQDRPIAAAAAAVGAGLLALRSPGLAGTLTAMALGGGGDAKRGKRR